MNAPEDTIPQRVIITWPAPHEHDHVMSTMGGKIHDADTGEELTGVFALTLRLGSEIGFSVEAMTVDLLEIADEHGAPVRGNGWNLLPTDEYIQFRAALHEAGLDGPVDEAQAADLLAREASFTSPRVRTTSSTYLVAEMRIAGDEK